MPSWGDILEWIGALREDHGQEAYDIALEHYLSRLHDYTGRDTVLYMSDWTQPDSQSPNQSITDNDLQGFMEVVSGQESSDLDLIIHSPGGSPEAAEQIVLYLREHYDNIRMIVPQSAKSAATLMTCAANEVVMGDHSSLGPIDPQMRVPTQFGPRLVPAYSILDQFEQAKNEYERTGEIGAWGPILTQYGPGLLAECEDAIELSQELAQDWSAEYMMDDEQVEAGEHEELAQYLNNRENFRSHGRPINRSEADAHGFNVSPLEDDDDFQDLVLSVYHSASILFNETRVSKFISNHDDNRYVYFSSPPEPEQGEAGE